MKGTDRVLTISKFPVLALSTVVLLLTSIALHSQSITMTPGYVNVVVGGKVQYSGVVTGLRNTNLAWFVSGVKGGTSQNGTITQNGLYTAPATVPANGVTILALASDNKTLAIEYVSVSQAGPAIKSISPSPIPVGQYTVTVTGSGFQPGATVIAGGIALSTTYVNSTTLKALGWHGSVGMVSFQVQNLNSVPGAALSVAFRSSTPQTISPASATVKLGSTQQFTSTGATSWTASAGNISASGLYTAPSIMPASSNVTITSTGGNGSASAVVTLMAPLSISPAAASVSLGATQQFIAAGATSWTASVGSITASGLYTAPTAVSGSSSAQVTATGPAGSATATVALIAPAPAITAVSGGQLPLGIFTVTVNGTGFVSGSIAQLNGTPLATTYNGGTLTASGFAGQSGTANITVSNGTSVSAPYPVQVGVQNALASPAAARRFLEQAAFGPTPNDALHLQTIGMQGWLNEQFNMPQVSAYDLGTGPQASLPTHFLTMAVSNQDQLRQRVALALSQIFVTSLSKITWDQDMFPFQNMLLGDAFANYRQIMGDVTLSPAMGNYLDMANNAMANPAAGSVANENYARELMQLFTIGNIMLNQDGSPQIDSNGMPIATYSQFTVTEFARVFTGWTYMPIAGSSPYWGSYITENGPMVPYPSEHDSGSKQLLNGFVSPAGASPQQDLNNALDNIFNHPNLGPFVGRQLIQHLVKSNPSPAYIARIAAVFNNNGQNVRGDMRAVITAILLDPEARANDQGGQDQLADGHLQEPGLFLAGMVRAFNGQMTDQNYYSAEMAKLGQDMFRSPSVFNYYAPTYVVPGTSLTGGEFQIHSPNNAIVRANEVALLFSAYDNPVQSYGPGTTIDLTPFLPLASNPTTLVNALDLTLTHGVMPAAMKAQIVQAVTADTVSSLHQVQTGCYLILSSSYYNVWH